MNTNLFQNERMMKTQATEIEKEDQSQKIQNIYIYLPLAQQSLDL